MDDRQSRWISISSYIFANSQNLQKNPFCFEKTGAFHSVPRIAAAFYLMYFLSVSEPFENKSEASWLLTFKYFTMNILKTKAFSSMEKVQ